MRTLAPKCLGLLAAALLLAGPLAETGRPQEESAAATRQYAAAAKLQNLKSYDLAAEAWFNFIRDFKSDARLGTAYYNLGVCYYLDGELDRAQTTFDTVVGKFPKLDKLADAYLYLAASQYALAQKGKTEGKAELCDKAVRNLDALLSKFPQSPFVADALYYRGECLYMRGKKQEAIQSYRQLLDKYPKSTFAAEATYALGVCQEELGQHDEAGKTYDAFLRAFPEHELAPEVSLRRAETLLAAGQLDEAAKRFAAAAGAPGFKLADYAALREADCRAELKQYVEAAAAYQAMVAKFPKSEHAGRAAVAAGKCYYLAGKYDEARKALDQVVSAGGLPAYEAAHWIARSWLKDGQPAQALQAVESILAKAIQDKSPMAAQLAMDRADAVYEIPDRKKDSIDLYAAVAGKYPDDPVAPQALYMAGFAALEQGESEAARKHASAFLAKYAEHELAPDVMHIQAESDLLLKRFPEAEAEYAQLLKRYPDHADAGLWKARRGLALQLQKKYKEAVAALEPAVGQVHRPEVAAEVRHLIGVSQLELGQPEAAVKSLEASLAAQPKWREADETLLALATAYSQLKDLDKAKATLEKLIAEFPKSKVLDKAQYRLGEYAYLGGDFNAAVAAYRTLADRWPESPLVPYALHELGCAQMELGDNAGAEQSLTTLLEKHAGHELAATARLSRGMARHRLKKYAPAVEDLQAFLATNPPQAEACDARYLLGLCQVGLSQYQPAVATFQALLKADPQYANADNTLYQLAWALKLSGDEAEAARSFQDLATKYPNSDRAAEAQFHVGEFMYDKKDYGRAAVAYYAAMQKAGKSDLDEKAAHKLGWSYYHQEQYDNAQKTFRYQLTRYPEGPYAADAAFMEAESYFEQDKFREALDAYAKATSPSKEEFQALRLLHEGQAAAQLKDWQRSLEFLRKCTEQFPESPCAAQAFYEQGRAQQNLDKLGEAIKLYEHVIDASGNAEVAARAQFMIGEIQFGQKDYKEAVKSYFKVMYGYSYPAWQSEATFEAARCFEVLQKPDQAIKLYKELLDKFPESSRVPVAKERMKELGA